MRVVNDYRFFHRHPRKKRIKKNTAIAEKSPAIIVTNMFIVEQSIIETH